MKKMKKRLMILLVTLIAAMSMTFPASAAQVKYKGNGYLTPGVEYVVRVKYVSKVFKSSYLILKQNKGTARYKKANGRITNKSVYGKIRVVIKEGGDNGKTVVNKIWKNGTFTYKCRTNTNYTIKVSYEGTTAGQVLIGPLYYQGWGQYPYWKWVY